MRYMFKQENRINIKRFVASSSGSGSNLLHIPQISISGTITKEDIKTLDPKYLPLNGEGIGYSRVREDEFDLNYNYFENGISVDSIYYYSGEDVGDWYCFVITGELKSDLKIKDLNDISSLSVTYDDYADDWKGKTLTLQKYSSVEDGTEYTVFSSCGNPGSVTIEANKLNMMMSLSVVYTGNTQRVTVTANINKDYFEGLCNYYDSEDLYQDIQNNELSSNNYYYTWNECYIYPKLPGVRTVIHQIPSLYLETAYIKGSGFNAESGNFGYNSASGHYSHAEGYRTNASGHCSHAEGYRTNASEYYSHAEGDETRASSSYQHVQGRYNIEDTSDKYADIIGNGTYNARSNAYTLDWNGNAWFAGNIKIGGTSYDDENAIEVSEKLEFNTEYNAETNKVATMTDVNNATPNLVYNTTYNAETNKIATMADIEAATASSISSITFINKPICNLTEYYNTTLTDEQKNTLSKKLQNYSVMVDVVGGKPVYELVVEFDDITNTSRTQDSDSTTVYFDLLHMTLSFGNTYGGDNLYYNNDSFFLIKDSCIYPEIIDGLYGFSRVNGRFCGEFSDFKGYVKSGGGSTCAVFEDSILDNITDGDNKINKMMFTIRYQKATDTEYQDAIQVLNATEEL